MLTFIKHMSCQPVFLCSKALIINYLKNLGAFKALEALDQKRHFGTHRGTHGAKFGTMLTFRH